MNVPAKDNIKKFLIIIRKGLKEFLQYVKPLCNFHINTLAGRIYAKIVQDILEKSSNSKFTGIKSRNNVKDYKKRITDLNIIKDNTIIFDDYISSWQNLQMDENDAQQVIISKFFINDEFESLRKKEKLNESKDENDISDNLKKKAKYNKHFCYNTITYNKDEKTMQYDDWKSHKIKEYSEIQLYEFIKDDNIDEYYIDCFTAEYIDSTKYQFDYMKDVIKVIYYLKFFFGIDIRLCIKLLRICTLNNMTFYIKYLSNSGINIITDMIRTCGGKFFTNINNYNISDDIIFLVTYNDYYKAYEDEIKKDLRKYKNFVLLDLRFIIDSYYFMTDIRDKIYDSEYMIYI